MGKNFMRKLLTVAMTLALVMTSCVFAFAADPADSPTVGKVSTIKTTANYSKKTLRIAWAKVEGAEKYKVYVNGKLVKTTTSNIFTLENMRADKNYKIQIAAVKGDKVGEKSDLVNKSANMRWYKRTTNTKAKGLTGKASISWSKVSGATGYQILQYKGGKWKVVKTVKSGSTTSALIHKLSKGSHKFKVRAMKGNYRGILTATYTAKVK